MARARIAAPMPIPALTPIDKPTEDGGEFDCSADEVLFEIVVVGDMLLEKLEEVEEFGVLFVVAEGLCEEVEGVELNDVVVKSPAFHRIDKP